LNAIFFLKIANVEKTLMLAIFKKNPTRENLDNIITDSLNTLCKIKADPNAKGLTVTLANSYFNLWVRADSTPGYTNRAVLNDYFEQILNDIDQFKKYSFQHEQVRQIYENLLQIYSEKLIHVYTLSL